MFILTFELKILNAEVKEFGSLIISTKAKSLTSPFFVAQVNPFIFLAQILDVVCVLTSCAVVRWGTDVLEKEGWIYVIEPVTFSDTSAR